MRPRSAALRERLGGRPLLLTRPGSVNWLTGGLSDPVDITAGSDPVWAIETPHGRALITDEVEAPRISGDLDLAELGWDLLVVPWYDADQRLALAAEYAGTSVDDLATDLDGVGLDATVAMVAERMQLTEPDQAALRDLGALVGRALGQGIDAWQPGVTTDSDTAAAISAALTAEGAQPVCLIVGGDDRLRRYRHPLAVGDVIDTALMAVVVARRGGLHAAATRIAVTRADDPILTLVEEIAPVNDAVLAATLRGLTWGESTTALETAYASIGRPGSWTEHYQGGPIGFEQREFELAPGQSSSPYWDLAAADGTAVAWNPSATGGAKIEDTYLLGGHRLELLTPTPGWPTTAAADGTAQRSEVKVMS